MRKAVVQDAGMRLEISSNLAAAPLEAKRILMLRVAVTFSRRKGFGLSQWIGCSKPLRRRVAFDERVSWSRLVVPDMDGKSRGEVAIIMC